jgi:hypothetical protein
MTTREAKDTWAFRELQVEDPQQSTRAFASAATETGERWVIVLVQETRGTGQ